MKNNESIGALWKKEKTKDGKTTEFFSGKIDNIPVFIFKNNQKIGDSDIDYRIMQSEISEENENEKELICTGELWQKKQSKQSKIFYVGSFRGREIIIFENSFKKEDKHPSLLVFFDLSVTNDNEEK